MRFPNVQGYPRRDRCGVGYLRRTGLAFTIFMAVASASMAVAVPTPSLVLVRVLRAQAKIVSQGAGASPRDRTPFEVIYRVRARVLGSRNPGVEAGKVITICARRMWLPTGGGIPPEVAPVSLPGTDLLLPVIWFRGEWEYQQSCQSFSTLKIGIRSVPMPVAACDVSHLIKAFGALTSRRDFLPPTPFRSPSGGTEKAAQAAKIGADARKLLVSRNYFLWALGAYETVAYGTRAQAVGLLGQLLKTQPPTPRMRTRLRLQPNSATITPILSLRRATWLAYLFTRPWVPHRNRPPTSVIMAYFLHYLREYEAPDKDRYAPASPAGFGLPYFSNVNGPPRATHSKIPMERSEGH